MDDFCRTIGGITIMTFVLSYMVAAAFAPFGIFYLVFFN
jgi:hypothetical protein